MTSLAIDNTSSLPKRGPLIAGLSFLAGLAFLVSAGAARAADVIFLGEIHDNPAAHRVQADLLSELGPAAVVFEMFPPAAEAAIDADSRADPGRLAEVLDWEARGWPDFALYWPVFEAARGAALYGGGTDIGDVRRAVTEGAAEVAGPDDPFGLAEPLPVDQQAAREALQMAAHCDALPEEMLPGMVEAQRYRDAALAAAILRALGDTGGPVAVITGNGHARLDWGAPAMVRAVRPGAKIDSIGIYEEGAVPAEALHDTLRIVPPAEREDPCAAFRQG